MNKSRLIEHLRDLQGEGEGEDSEDGYKRDDLLVQCLNVPRSDLDEFLDELSQLLDCSPDTYLKTLQTFISHIRNKNSGANSSINLQARWSTTLPTFISLLITVVIIKNMHHSDIPSFGELLYNCIELLCWADRLMGTNKYSDIMKQVFSAILNTKGALEVLVSGASGNPCLKRIYFEVKKNNLIERKELLKAVNAVAALVEECSKYQEISGFSLHKACTALLETLKNYQNVEVERTQNKKRSVRNLSFKDEQYLTLLEMEFPQNPSDLPNFLRDLEQRKIDSFQDLMEFLPCTCCHEKALMYFSPDKYFSLIEKESVKVGRPERLFDLPFEFDENDRLGPWDVLLSEDVIKDMRTLESPHTINAVMKKLAQLSSGAWEKHGFRRTVLSQTTPVYEIELPDYDGLKIFWQVDCGFSIRSYLLTQLVKVWAITTDHDRIRKTLGTLEMVHQVHTAKHIYRCTVEGENKIILPKIFEDEETKSAENGHQIYDEKMLEVHKILVTTKFTPLSKNLFKSLVTGGSNFTFQVSKVEYEIINNPSSAIIIGRSGTGKTTCILFRQVASYLTKRISSLHENHKRQIFITLSYSLCRRVRVYFNKLQESALLARRKMSIDQVFEYLRKKDESKIDMNDNTMLEEDDEEKELSSIPNSFHQLTENHFPLFITYKKLSKMLQGTFGIDTQKLITQQRPGADNDEEEEEFYQESSFDDTVNKHFVDYDRFKKLYWPRFSDYHRQKFDCELVYSEFSIIKCLNPEVGCLSREDYRTISTKKYPTFCYNRDQIYDLFERYERMKARNYHFDSIDRALAILHCAKTKALNDPHIHEIYIDECQDNNIVDFALIFKVFNRVDSIFFAGDAAQCIAQGSSFRFQDLLSLIYQWELNRIKTDHNWRVSLKPKQFELNINYRSHNGILQLAASVIDLIWRFFPNSIDRLSREHGEIGGPQPIIFDELMEGTSHFETFFNANQIEFGAEQVIIVRNDAAKKRVKEKIGKVGLVMTVFDAKGMEFNDVLLYDFFTDSPARSEWRVILSVLDNHSKGIQTFSHEKHYILSSELKNLYVAVTRAREHIWIFDENAEWSKPIRTYWDHHGLVKVIRNLEEIKTLPILAKKSSPHEWNQRGKVFFEHRNYEQAISCFEKSGNEENRKLANAYYLQQIARTSDYATIKYNFIAAAQAFKNCFRPIQAVSCYQKIHKYKEAGDVYVEWKMYEPAARCYLKANMYLEAGENFEKVKKYGDAAFAYIDGDLYEIAANLILGNRKEIDGEIYNNITHVVKIHYRTNIAISNGKFEEAVDMFIRLIDNEEENIIEALQFILYICRASILKETMTFVTSQSTPSKNTLQEHLLFKASEIIMKVKSQLIITSKRWNNLIEEFHLYSAYLNKDLNKAYECMQFFKCRKVITTEFHAVNIWLHILPQFDIQADYWRERLVYLLKLCEWTFSCQNITVTNKKLHKDFEDIFCVSEVKNNSRKRQIPFGSPLLQSINEKHGSRIENAERTVNDQHTYDANDVYQTISQCLASYIFELIQNANRKGREIPDIGSQICDRFTHCPKQNCRKHHVTPTPSILHKRITLACLQYTVMLKLTVLYHRRLLKKEQSREVRGLQRWWAERLVNIHIRYQSSQISCPEVTYMMLNKIPDTRNGLISFANKKWLVDVSNDVGNFEVMLKCMLVLQQLKDEQGIKKFDSETSKTKMLSDSKNLPIGFEHYKGNHQMIPVGNRLSLFFSNLYSNNVIDAISSIKIFIQYAISNAKLVNLVTPDALGDLISLMEFTISLIFAIGPGCCEFYLPRAYLVNYFVTFTSEPLIPSRRSAYNRESYLAAIENSFDQVQLLLQQLIYDEHYSLVILRLIRLLILIGINESTLSDKVCNLFNYLNNNVSSTKIKRYLKEKSIERLVDIMKNDLEERGCDSLVIVHYGESLSKFSSLENRGIMKLTYNSIEEFHSALQQIISSTVTDQELFTEIKSWLWLRKICDSPQAQNAARKIQVWFRKALEKPCRVRDKIYNKMTSFYYAILIEKGKEVACNYNNILLEGQTVDVIVELTKLQSRMDAIRNNLQKSINNRSSNINKIERCLELQDELKYNYSEDVELALEQLLNLENHMEVDIEWLKEELEHAKITIDQVLEWIDKCETQMT